MTFNSGPTVIYTFWSPDGSRLAYNLRDESCWIIEVGKPWGEQTPQRVPNPPDQSDVFRAFSWSPDGRNLGGWINSRSSMKEFSSTPLRRTALSGSPILVPDRSGCTTVAVCYSGMRENSFSSTASRRRSRRSRSSRRSLL